MSDERLIRLRYRAVCAGCAGVLEPGVRGWWESDRKAVRCETCGPGAPPIPEVMLPPAPTAVPEFDAPIEPGVAGASAQREFEQRRRRLEDDVRANHPHVAGFLLAVTPEPQSTRAWAKGAAGEERVGRRLDRLTENGAVVLHDRGIPNSRANIDHVVVARSGVSVIDTKNHDAKVELRDRGGWFRRDERLFVAGRDRTNLIVGMAKQVEAVARAVDSVSVPVHPVLCFTRAEWGSFARPFVVDGVLVIWPRKLVKRISKPDRHDIAVHNVAERIAINLPVR